MIENGVVSRRARELMPKADRKAEKNAYSKANKHCHARIVEDMGQSMGEFDVFEESSQC